MVSADMRETIATKLNAMIDVPFLGEDQEQGLAEKLVDRCLGAVNRAVPSDEEIEQVKTDADSPDEARGMIKNGMVAKMNGMIDIPFANEEQEAMILSMIVDTFLKDKLASFGA